MTSRDPVRCTIHLGTQVAPPTFAHYFCFPNVYCVSVAIRVRDIASSGPDCCPLVGLGHLGGFYSTTIHWWSIAMATAWDLSLAFNLRSIVTI